MLRNKAQFFFISCLLSAIQIQAQGVSHSLEGLKFIAQLQAGSPQTLICYGTSLTANGAWVQQMDAELNTFFSGQLTVMNQGGSGQWSKWGVENLQTRVLDNNPDAVMIEFSMNDAVDRFNCSIDCARSNLENMILQIKLQNPECDIILMTMNPATGGSSRPQLLEHYEMVRQMAIDSQLPLVDHYLNWKVLQDSNSALFEEYVPDGVHPTVEACSKIITPELVAFFTAQFVSLGRKNLHPRIHSGDISLWVDIRGSHRVFTLDNKEIHGNKYSNSKGILLRGQVYYSTPTR